MSGKTEGCELYPSSYMPQYFDRLQLGTGQGATPLTIRATPKASLAPDAAGRYVISLARLQHLEAQLDVGGVRKNITYRNKIPYHFTSSRDEYDGKYNLQKRSTNMLMILLS